MNTRTKSVLTAVVATLFFSSSLAQAQSSEIDSNQPVAEDFFFPLSDETTTDKVVAVIDHHPILLSELDLEARIILIVQGGTTAAFAKKLGDDVLRNMLTQLINQRLMENEAKRLQTKEDPPEVLNKIYDSFVQTIGGRRELATFLAMHETSEQRLLTVLDRLHRIDRFLSDKLGATARITEADAKEYFDANADAYEGRSFSTVKKSIFDKLIHERVKAETTQFLDSLRERAEIRLLPPFSPDNATYDLTQRDNMVRVKVDAPAEETVSNSDP